MNFFDVFINIHYSHEFKFQVIHYYIQNKSCQLVGENHIGVLIVNVPSLMDAYRNAILCFYQTLVFDFPIFVDIENTRTQIIMDIPVSIQNTLVQEVLFALPLNCTIINMEKDNPMFSLRESCMYYMLSKIYTQNVSFLRNDSTSSNDKSVFLKKKEKEKEEEEEEDDNCCKEKISKSKKRRLQRQARKRRLEQENMEEREKEKEQNNDLQIELKQKNKHFLHKYNTSFNQLILIKDFTNHVYLYKNTMNSIF